MADNDQDRLLTDVTVRSDDGHDRRTNVGRKDECVRDRHWRLPASRTGRRRRTTAGGPAITAAAVAERIVFERTDDRPLCPGIGVDELTANGKTLRGEKSAIEKSKRITTIKNVYAKRAERKTKKNSVRVR